MDGEKTHGLTDALEQLRRLKQVLEGVRRHQLASVNEENFQEYDNLLSANDRELCTQGFGLTYWEELEGLGLPERALSFCYVKESLSQEIRVTRHLTVGQQDAWLEQFMGLVESLHEELRRRTSWLLVSGYSDAEMTQFFDNNTVVCQRLGAALRHVYDWEVQLTASRHKENIQKDTDWSEWFTACVWLTTRTPDATCHALYAECVENEKTKQQELQDILLAHVVDHREHYLPKVPRPGRPRPDDMDVGGKMPSQDMTAVLSRRELLRDTPQPVHCLLQRLQDLLAEGEIGRASAPRALEAGPGWVDSAYYAWNEGLGWVGPNYVSVRCYALLSVGSNVLPDALRGPLLSLQGLLNAAAAIQREVVSPSEEKEHQRRVDESRRDIYYSFKDALPEVKKAVKSFGVRDGLAWEQTRAELKTKTQNELKSNDYAVALSAFLTAMHKYLARYIAAKSLQWDGA